MTGMTVLVVYFSQGNNTGRVAEDIASLLDADIERVVDTKDRSGFFGFMGAGRDAIRKRLTSIEPTTKDPAKYDLVILGSPIWGFGHMTPAMRTYLTQNKGKISRYALFCTRWFINPEKFFASFEEFLGEKPVATLGFTTKELSEDGYSAYEAEVKNFVGGLSAKNY